MHTNTILFLVFMVAFAVVYGVVYVKLKKRSNLIREQDERETEATFQAVREQINQVKHDIEADLLPRSN